MPIKHVPNFKEKLQLQKDADPGMYLQSSFLKNYSSRL